MKLQDRDFYIKLEKVAHFAETSIKKSIELRYLLMPYIYTSFMESVFEGCPIQKPLIYDYQDDKKAMTNSSEFLFGSSILAAPVVEKGAKKRKVYLPKGEGVLL